MWKELETIKQVLSRRNYLFIFLISSFFAFLIFYFLTLWTVTNRSLRIFIEMNGYNYTFFTFLLLGIVALLLGVYLSLFIFKCKLSLEAKRQKKISIGVFVSGFIAGLLGSGCPMCGSVIFALFGMPLALFFLPFKGLELRILAVIILIFSVYFLAKSLNECKVYNNKQNKIRKVKGGK